MCTVISYILTVLLLVKMRLPSHYSLSSFLKQPKACLQWNTQTTDHNHKWHTRHVCNVSNTHYGSSWKRSNDLWTSWLCLLKNMVDIVRNWLNITLHALPRPTWRANTHQDLSFNMKVLYSSKVYCVSWQVIALTDLFKTRVIATMVVISCFRVLFNAGNIFCLTFEYDEATNWRTISIQIYIVVWEVRHRKYIDLLANNIYFVIQDRRKYVIHTFFSRGRCWSSACKERIKTKYKRINFEHCVINCS